MMYGQACAWGTRLVHYRSHVGMVLVWGWVAWLPVLIRVKNLMCLLDCDVRAMLNHLMHLFEHVESKCD